MVAIMLSHQQIRMLKMFERGWGFRLINERPGSWTTYWSLVRRKLICQRQTVTHAGKPVVMAKLSETGKRLLDKHGSKV